MPKKKKEPYANSSFDTDKAIAMRNDGATYKQIANAIGCSQSQAARICQYSGECKTASRNRGFNLEREKLIGEWLKLARKGYSTYEIAAMYPEYSRYYINSKLNGRCYRPGKGNGGAAKANAERSKKANLKQLLDAQEELGDRFIVCSIFKNSHALLICKECGYVFDRYLDPSVKEHRCPQCEAKRVEESRQEREKRRIITSAFKLVVKCKQREKLEEERKQKLDAWLDEAHVCKECGKLFTVRKLREANPWYFSGCPTFCSTECGRKFHKRNARHRRRERCGHGEGISLPKLVERDHGICYLCGLPVDESDCNHSDNGAFISGARYPSADHVIPLAKGGANDMSNAALAHHRCNAIKSDKLLEECEPSMFEW